LRCLFQRNWHSSVRFDEGQGEQELLVEVTYCGTDREACARLLIDPLTLIVKDAYLEKYRTPGESGCQVLKIPQLSGMEAYFKAGTVLREALAPLQDSYAHSLFAEAVRGVIQAETFLFKERGFASTDAYQDYWDKIYVNTCHYFSNLDRVTQGWYDHIGYSERRGNLFNRIKTQYLYLNGDSYLLTGNMTDSFHGVSVELELEKDKYKVKSARGELVRAPDPVCAEAVDLMAGLAGKELAGLKKKDIAQRMGGGNGCIHLIDLVFDGLETLELAQA
jgi:hypothetical protein